jgi:putative transcriptional regulator
MSKFADDLIESLTEALAHARGEKTAVRVRTVEVPNVQAIRRNLHMSQEKFAVTYRIPLSTLKNWEQGRRHPDAPAAAFLQVIARRPKETSEALAAD